MLIAIQLPENAEYQMLINPEDYDPSKHVLWFKESTDGSVSTPLSSKEGIKTDLPIAAPEIKEAEVEAELQNIVDLLNTEASDDLSADEIEELGPEPEDDRMMELISLYEAEGYPAIKVIAIPLGISKPETGWEDAIPLIVEAETALNQ
jgi:hypothetical protein